MKTLWMFLLTSFSFCLAPAVATAQQDVLVVMSRGLGVSADAAKQDALINAMQQAVGGYVEGETLVENNKLIKETILSVSDGFVDSYDVVDGPKQRPDGLFEMTIKAKVKRTKMVERLNEVRISGSQVSSKDVAAEIITKVENVEQGEAILEKHLGGLLEKLLVARLLDEEGKPGADLRPMTRILPGKKIECGLNIQVYFDMQAFYEKVVPQLDKVLSAVGREVVNSGTWRGQAYRSYDLEGRCEITNYPIFTAKDWLGENVDGLKENEQLVALSIGRDQYGEDERFRLYVIDKDVYGEILKKIGMAAGDIQLHVYLLNDKGGIIRRELVSIDQNTWRQNQTNASVWYPLMMTFSGIPESDDAYPQPRNQTQNCLYLSPRFGTGNPSWTRRNIWEHGWIDRPGYVNIFREADNDSQPYSDTIFIPLRLEMNREDVERIGNIRFVFQK